MHDTDNRLPQVLILMGVSLLQLQQGCCVWISCPYKQHIAYTQAVASAGSASFDFAAAFSLSLQAQNSSPPPQKFSVKPYQGQKLLTL